jgi:2-polyprenyl-3-methyl-5-hydroxy-6-metoxy-1,4-benzoquinol methylase
MSGIYARYILPRCLDKACGIGPIEKQRAKVVPLAKGNVLEIGIGSGLNLPHYSADQVTSVTGVDPDDHIWKRSETRRKAAPFPVDRIGLSGENIPMETNSADTVVVTYTLCTIPDPVQALKEMRGHIIYGTWHVAQRKGCKMAEPNRSCLEKISRRMSQRPKYSRDF